MTGNRLILIPAILAALALPCSAALATQQGLGVMKNWQHADLCAHQAQTAFPDFTPEANAKRDARLKQCLMGQELPPRQPSSPQQ